MTIIGNEEILSMIFTGNYWFWRFAQGTFLFYPFPVQFFHTFSSRRILESIWNKSVNEQRRRKVFLNDLYTQGNAIREVQL